MPSVQTFLDLANIPFTAQSYHYNLATILPGRHLRGVPHPAGEPHPATPWLDHLLHDRHVAAVDALRPRPDLDLARRARRGARARDLLRLCAHRAQEARHHPAGYQGKGWFKPVGFFLVWCYRDDS